MIGKDSPFIIGGPCTIDPSCPSLFLETAHALKEAGVDALEVVFGNQEQILILTKVMIKQLI